jgi:hypothetical protein
MEEKQQEAACSVHANTVLQFRKGHDAQEDSPPNPSLHASMLDASLSSGQGGRQQTSRGPPSLRDPPHCYGIVRSVLVAASSS